MMRNISSFIYEFGKARFINAMTIHVCTPDRFGDKILQILFQREIDGMSFAFSNYNPGSKNSFLPPLLQLQKVYSFWIKVYMYICMYICS